MKPNLTPDLRPLAVEVETLTPHPRNARQGDVERIVDSLKRFGQTKPIVVQASTMHVVAGNHVFAAAKRLGWSHIAANVVDMSDDDAIAYLLADNRTSDLGSFDRDVLAEAVGLLSQADALVGTGYSQDEADALVIERTKIDVDRWTSESITSALRFETQGQYERWVKYLNRLRADMPEVETMAERLTIRITEVMRGADQ